MWNCCRKSTKKIVLLVIMVILQPKLKFHSVHPAKWAVATSNSPQYPGISRNGKESIYNISITYTAALTRACTRLRHYDTAGCQRWWESLHSWGESQPPVYGCFTLRWSSDSQELQPFRILTLQHDGMLGACEGSNVQEYCWMEFFLSV